MHNALQSSPLYIWNTWWTFISIHSIILPTQNVKIGAVKPSQHETLCKCAQMSAWASESVCRIWPFYLAHGHFTLLITTPMYHFVWMTSDVLDTCWNNFVIAHSIFPFLIHHVLRSILISSSTVLIPQSLSLNTEVCFFCFILACHLLWCTSLSHR